AGVRPVAPEVVNSLGMRLALIPPGRFRMGSPASEKGRQPDEPVHEVEISRPFYLGVFPVTQAQYQKVTGSNPSHFSRRGDWHEDDYPLHGETRDPQGPESGRWKVIRGGSWGARPPHCRAARRHSCPPRDLIYGFGFRVVLTVS